MTRAFTGRAARGIVNRFLTEHHDVAPVAYPEIHHVTSPLRAAARRRGDADGFNLWAGQAHELVQARPAGEIVRQMAADAAATHRSGQRRSCAIEVPVPGSAYHPVDAVVVLVRHDR